MSAQWSIKKKAVANMVFDPSGDCRNVSACCRAFCMDALVWILDLILSFFSIIFCIGGAVYFWLADYKRKCDFKICERRTSKRRTGRTHDSTWLKYVLKYKAKGVEMKPSVC